MPQDTASPPGFTLSQRLRRWWGDLVLLLILAGMIVWIVYILITDLPEKPSWLLVPITVIYSVLTLYMASAAFQNAHAARRSAEAMEASVQEQKLSRWAAYAAIVSFPKGQTYEEEPGGSVSVVLGNFFRQPIMDLRVGIWHMDHNHEGNIQYSSMVESDPIDVESDTQTVKIQLKPTGRPEAERARIANNALERYRKIFNNQTPKTALCLIEFSHRASMGPQSLVCDMQAAKTAAAPASTSSLH